MLILRLTKPYRKILENGQFTPINSQQSDSTIIKSKKQILNKHKGKS